MPGFNRDTTGATNQNVVYADNVDFSGSTAPTPKVTTDGQLLIGSSVAPNIRVGSLTSTGATITITPGHGTINLETAGGVGIHTIDGNTGSVTGSTVTIETPVSTGTLNFSGLGTALTLNLMDGSGDLAIGNSATATGGNSVSIGTSATDGGGPGNVTIGNSTTSSYYTGLAPNVVIGNGANVSGPAGTGCNSSVTIGASAFGGSGDNVSIGHNTSSSGNSVVVIGTFATDNAGGEGVVIGSLANGPSGGYSVILGYNSGSSNTSGGSNITISNTGSSGESNVIRIGTQGSGNGQQDACYVAGINNTNSSGFTSPLPVFVDSSTGQLGFGSSGGSGISTINGDSGSATGSTVTLNANSNSGSSVNFAASGSTVDLTVTDARFNTIIGTGAGNGSLTGHDNVILGYQAFASATTDANNIGIGYQALNGATGSLNNIAIGLLSMSTAGFAGIRNVAIGNNSGQSFTNGSDNTACGYASLGSVTSGGHNTALGDYSLYQLTTGSNNIAIGISSTNGGTAYTSSESNNIVIGNPGTVGESNILRIGTQGSSTGQQNKCYIAGIEAATYSAGSPKPALTYCDTSDGQLVSTQAVGSSTATSTFGSLVVGTGSQNTANYAILVNVSIVVTAATSATITMGIGSTSTPTTNTMITTFTVAAASTYSFSGFVPAGYYMLVNTTGTITVGSITTQACAVG